MLEILMLLGTAFNHDGGFVYKYFSSLKGRLSTSQQHAVVNQFDTHTLLATSLPSLTPSPDGFLESLLNKPTRILKLCLGLLSGEVNLRPPVTQSGQRCK